MKFSFIGQVAEEQRQLPPGVRFPVVFMCRMLEVTRQGFYEWKKRPVSAHDQKDAELAARIRYLHQERHKNRAGIERILWDLQEEGHVTSERRVRRLARAAGLQCVHPGPSARTTVQDSKAIGGLVDLVDRQFTAPEPDQLWVGDITYIWTYSGFAYLATLIDMCSNKVVGWAVDDHMRTGLVLEAVDNALAARGPGIGIGELVVHHDRGSQYTSGRYRDRLFAEGIIPSVGHTGICYDNAAAESFNATIKKELIYQHVWRDAGEVRTAVFDYIERYYNHVRKQRRLGKISPVDYERQLDNWAQKQHNMIVHEIARTPPVFVIIAQVGVEVVGQPVLGVVREQPQHHLQSAAAGAQQRDFGVGVDHIGGQLGGDRVAGRGGGVQGFAGGGDFLLRGRDQPGVLGGGRDGRVGEQAGQAAFGCGQRLLRLAHFGRRGLAGGVAGELGVRGDIGDVVADLAGAVVLRRVLEEVLLPPP